PLPPPAGRPTGSPLPNALRAAPHARDTLLPPALGGRGGRPSPDLLAPVRTGRVEDGQVEVAQVVVLEAGSGDGGEPAPAPGAVRGRARRRSGRSPPTAPRSSSGARGRSVRVVPFRRRLSTSRRCRCRRRSGR